MTIYVKMLPVLTAKQQRSHWLKSPSIRPSFSGQIQLSHLPWTNTDWVGTFLPAINEIKIKPAYRFVFGDIAAAINRRSLCCWHTMTDYQDNSLFEVGIESI